MDNEKIKAEDLGKELELGLADLKRWAADRLGYDGIKTRLSPVPKDMADKLRALKVQDSASSGGTREEIAPGQIVKRRRVLVADSSADAAAHAPAGTVAEEPVMAEPAKHAKAASAKPRVQADPGPAPLDSAVKPEAKADGKPETVEATAVPAVTESAMESADASDAQKVRQAKNQKSSQKSRKPLETPPARVVRPVADVAEVKAEAAIPAPVVVPVEALSEKVAETAVVEAPKSKAAPKAVANAKVVTPAKAPVPAKAEASELSPAPEGGKATPVAEPEVRLERQLRAPAASAEPEGSSQPSLLPPISESRRSRDDDEMGDNGYGRGRAQTRGDSRPTSAAPQVRVISRPDPNQARPVNRDGAFAGRDDSRPAGPRAPRPGGAGGPGGVGRPGGAPRPGGPRPSSPGTPGGDAGAFSPFGQQPPVEGADQSRKKRNKGRRTVDFPQGGDDFSRRKGGDDEDVMGRSRSRGRKPKKSLIMPQSTQPMKAAKRKIRVEEAIRVADLAHQMSVKSGEIIKVLFGLGVMATINNALDIDTATLVAAEFGYEVEKVGFSENDYLVPSLVDEPEQLKLRPPVVTIMGHVDHGKTSLLDAIRKTSVTSAEAGGITQHIGAYHVKTKRGDIVFLDTPGHEAFTSMRMRGAQITDLVVLVVAADDGVMEQTREAISHSRAAGVPILVAVNKIDKESANPDRVLRELAELGLQAESWGGDTVVSYVSAKTREGLDELLELIALQAEIMELRANPDKPARGHVVEAKLDKGRGPVATVLIQEGTLHQGDAFVCGVFAGRVRAIFNDQGRKIKEAGPSIPVEIQGFEGVPEAGEEFVMLADEKMARRIAESRAVKLRERELSRESRVTLETFLARSASDTEAQVLNLVVKADVQGSLEAIIEALRKLSTDKVRIEIIHGGAGAISESDIMLAAASSAIIIGFNVRPTAKVKDVAEQEHVDIRFYDIIYKLVEEIKSAMAGMLAPVTREVYLGQAEVRDTFSVPKVGVIAGCYVADGKIARNAGVRLLREGVVVYTGKISSLKRFKDDAKEVPKGMECGMGLENFNDIKVADVIEAFETVEEAATL